MTAVHDVGPSSQASASSSQALALGGQAFDKAGEDHDGILLLSDNRAYAHEESAYDAQYENAELDTEPGRRLIEILTEAGIGAKGRLLEIGCGTGLLSVGLSAIGFFDEIVVTDGSLQFLKIAQRKLGSIKSRSEVRLALLTDADTAEIGTGYFDVIAMRSVLHHVTDFRAFAELLLRKLKPGGVLAMYEPCAEMFMWMGTLAALFPAVAQVKGFRLDEADLAHVDTFVRTMEFYLRRDLDKAGGEDKYCFWHAEMLDIAASAKAHTLFRSENNPNDVVSGFINYARYCMGWSPGLIDKLESSFEELRTTINGFLAGSQVPDVTG